MDVGTSVRPFAGKRRLVERAHGEADDLGVVQLSWALTSLGAAALARAA